MAVTLPVLAHSQRTSTGTGFSITEDGYFITCFHVVVNSGKITLDGNVVGVVASKLDAAAIARQTGDIPQHVNYAIKSQHVLDMLDKVAAQIPAVKDSLARVNRSGKGRGATFSARESLALHHPASGTG